MDATPYIWKEIGTSCRNLPQVHTVMRMMRLIGEMVMAPELVAPYFGTVEKPECHLLYNVTTMTTTWHTVSTKDVRLLRKQLDIVAQLPKEQVVPELSAVPRQYSDKSQKSQYSCGFSGFGKADLPHFLPHLAQIFGF